MLNTLVTSSVISTKDPLTLLSNLVGYITGPGRFVLNVVVTVFIAFHYDEWELTAFDAVLLVFMLVIPVMILGKIFFSATSMLLFVGVLYWFGPTADFFGYYAYHSVHKVRQLWCTTMNHNPNAIIPELEFNLLTDWNYHASDSKKMYGDLYQFKTEDPMEDLRTYRTFIQRLRFVVPNREYHKQIAAFGLVYILNDQEVSIFRSCNSEEKRNKYSECKNTGGAKPIGKGTVENFLITANNALEQAGVPLSRWVQPEQPEDHSSI